MARPSAHTDIVYQAVNDLSNMDGVARRNALKSRTGLPFTIVDEAIKRLKEEEGSVKMLKPGVFVPVKKYYEHACSATVLEDGRCKMEKGDELVTLTPREAASFLGLLVGYAMMNQGVAG